MNIISIGHRLTILKGVYDIKTKQGIAIDSDHWIPPCMFANDYVCGRTSADSSSCGGQ